MLRALTLVIVAVGLIALGVVVGRITADPDEVTTASPSNKTTAPPRLRTMVCAAVGRARPPDGDDPEEVEAAALRARWCEAQLEECTRQQDAVREPWPDVEETAIEAPEAWTQTIEEAIDGCGIPVAIEVVDCSEYPCVAALRPRNPGMSEDEHEAEMEALIASLRGCEPLQQAFGLGDPEHEEVIDVYRLDARCGNRRDKFFALQALAPRGPAFARLTARDKTATDDRDLMRLLYRRADDLVGMWPCDP